MPLITVRSLNSFGRAGNQLFLYAFAKGYARAHGCELQIPADWWGREVFINANEPAITHRLKSTVIDTDKFQPLGYFFGEKDIDLNVYAQHQIYLDYYTRKQAREWMAMKPEMEGWAPKAKTQSVMHVRRGDYVTKFSDRYCLVSDESYTRAINQFNIPGPVHRVCENWRRPDDMLNQRGLGWLQDFLFLRDAAYLLRANSSFSVWAGWLGNGKVYSPVVGRHTGWSDVPFVEGNWPATARFNNQSDLHLKEA